VGKSIIDLARRGQADPISIVVLLGISTNIVASFFGGSARLLLVRESLFTGAFGFACFVSLLLPRPMMFYFARHFIAGADPQRRARFDASWQFPEVRSCHRLITTVWGCVFVGELLFRIVFDLQSIGGEGSNCLAHPFRRTDHRHHDLGIQLWATRPLACRGPA
jgi:hypothetical protein